MLVAKTRFHVDCPHGRLLSIQQSRLFTWTSPFHSATRITRYQTGFILTDERQGTHLRREKSTHALALILIRAIML